MLKVLIVLGVSSAEGAHCTGCQQCWMWSLYWVSAVLKLHIVLFDYTGCVVLIVERIGRFRSYCRIDSGFLPRLCWINVHFILAIFNINLLQEARKLNAFAFFSSNSYRFYVTSVIMFGPGAHPATCAMGTGCLSARGFNHPPLSSAGVEERP